VKNEAALECWQHRRYL